MNNTSGQAQTSGRTQTADDAGDIDLLMLLRALWRGWPFIALCLVIAGAWGWYKANIASVPIYSATATMIVDRSADPRSMDTTSAFFGYGYVNTSAMNTEMEIVTSRALVGQLVDRLDLTASPLYNPFLAPAPEPAGPVAGLVDRIRGWTSAARDWVRGKLTSTLGPDAGPESAYPPFEDTPEQRRQSTVSALQGVLSASYDERSYLFYISATTPDPMEAIRLANAMADVYRDDNLQQKVEAAETSAVWLSERVADLRGELDEQQAEINRRRSENALTTSDSGLTGFEAQLAAAESRRFETERALAAAEAALARLIAATDAPPGAQAEAAGDAQLRLLLQSVEAGDGTAVARFDLRYSQLLQQAQSERDRLAVSLESIADEIMALTDQIARTGDAYADIRQMEQDLASVQLLYDTFSTQLRETSLRLGSQQSDVRILSEAIHAVQIAPRKARILGMALLVGLLLGAAVVLLREVLHRGYRSAGELEDETGLTVLGQIPRIPARGRAKQIAWLAKRPASAVAESVRNLRTSVLLANAARPPQVILTTSSIPGEGKTTISIALAQNLAGMGRKVLLIEGDLRRRQFPTYFPGAAGRPGLLSVITGKTPLEEATWHDRDLGFDVLIGEKATGNAADILSSEDFRTLLTALREKYDHILIDSPPVLAVPDARVIAPMVDAVLFMVRWNRTPRGLVEDALKLLRTVNVQVSGLVLGQIDPRGMRRYGYGHRYGSYSRRMGRYYDG